MDSRNRQPPRLPETWILAGYQTVATQGLAMLKVERLARAVGLSKSSFYHHFADRQTFVEVLLDHHLRQARALEAKERSARSLDPELVAILVEHKTDLLFNRELRVNRADPLLAAALAQSDRAVGEGFLRLWSRELGLPFPNAKLEALYGLALENFLLRATPDQLNPQWLSAHFAELNRLARALL